jgi:hypothetical protein
MARTLATMLTELVLRIVKVLPLTETYSASIESTDALQPVREENFIGFCITTLHRNRTPSKIKQFLTKTFLRSIRHIEVLKSLYDWSDILRGIRNCKANLRLRIERPLLVVRQEQNIKTRQISPNRAPGFRKVTFNSPNPENRTNASHNRYVTLEKGKLSLGVERIIKEYCYTRNRCNNVYATCNILEQSHALMTYSEL